MTSPSKLALIDADVLIYRVGFTTEDAEEKIAYWRLDETLHRMLEQLETSTYRCYLTSTDKSNFRYSLYPKYKANRVQPKPRHYQALRDFLQDKHSALIVAGHEADDELAIDLLTPEDEFEKVLCSIDKDLDQIAGWHFNFVTNRLYQISEIEGHRCFYMQLLEGDVTDNIDGCDGIGKVKARRILEGCQSEQEMYESVLTQYLIKQGNDPGSIWLNGNLLWIRRKVSEPWIRNSVPVSKESLQTDLDHIQSRFSMKQLISSSQYQSSEGSTSPIS